MATWCTHILTTTAPSLWRQIALSIEAVSNPYHSKLLLNQRLKSNILQDFDKRLRSDLNTDLYSFIAIVKLDDGGTFHDAVDTIFARNGAKGLREFLDGLVSMLEEFKDED